MAADRVAELLAESRRREEQSDRDSTLKMAVSRLEGENEMLATQLKGLEEQLQAERQRVDLMGRPPIDLDECRKEFANWKWIKVNEDGSLADFDLNTVLFTPNFPTIQTKRPLSPDLLSALAFWVNHFRN